MFPSNDHEAGGVIQIRRTSAAQKLLALHQRTIVGSLAVPSMPKHARRYSGWATRAIIRLTHRRE
ncbi:MAG: hypothetical protein ACRDRK_25180 [Pseudonocardia sp.]